jgi:hypothetical protein
MPQRVAPTSRPFHSPTEWREGVSERQPSLIAWRSFIDARFERGQPLFDHVVSEPAEETPDWEGSGAEWLTR